MSYDIRPVNGDLLDVVLPLIADYQRFYEQEVDEDRNRLFFGGLAEPDAAQFVAFEGEHALGFVTLYFLPSSLSAKRYCLLNDLYTVPEARGKGVGRALIAHAQGYAASKGYGDMEWLTSTSNVRAQRLYDSLPTRKSSWYIYNLPTT